MLLPWPKNTSKENKEPPNSISYQSQNYLWDSKALSYGLVKEKAAPKIEPKPAPLSPKLLALKRIAPPLAQKYQRENKEPPDRLTYKSQNYLWNPGAVKYNLVEKLQPKPIASASIPKVPRLGVSAPSIPVKKRRAPARPRKQRLGNLEAGLLLSKIDEALKKHSKKKGDVLDFLVRAYQRYYRKDRLSRQEAIDLMRIGLAYRGSLKAILKNMKREFKERPMRHYVFGKLFNISRHEAKKIFAVYLYSGSGS